MHLHDDEVHKLVDVPNKGVEGLSWNRVVLARAELGSQAIVQESLSGDLGEDGNTKDHPGQLQGIANDVKISGCKD